MTPTSIPFLFSRLGFPSSPFSPPSSFFCCVSFSSFLAIVKLAFFSSFQFFELVLGGTSGPPRRVPNLRYPDPLDPRSAPPPPLLRWITDYCDLPTAPASPPRPRSFDGGRASETDVEWSCFPVKICPFVFPPGYDSLTFRFLPFFRRWLRN